MSDNWKFETRSVHAGYRPDPTTKAVVPPIYQTVAYAFDSAQHGADLFDLSRERRRAPIGDGRRRAVPHLPRRRQPASAFRAHRPGGRGC